MCINIIIITFWKSNSNTQGQTHTHTHIPLLSKKLKYCPGAWGEKKKKNFGKSIQLFNINVKYKDATQSKNTCVIPQNGV